MSKKKISPEKAEKLDTKTFFDCVLPGIIKFNVDHYIVGDSYRCAWAVREYPPLTEQQAIFARIADKNGVTLRIYHRLVEAAEQRKIIQNATRKNKMKSTANDMADSVEAEGNLQDVIDLLAGLRKSRECLLHCAVFIELKAKSLESLRELQNETLMELTRAKITVDRLTLADEEGGKLKNRCIFFCDEFGTLPKIQDAEMIFSASRSRRLQIVPIIQSFSQLDKNYGKEGEEIIVDNTQLTIFGGFAPNSPSAEVLSKALGTRTVLTGSVNKGKNDPSESLQMTERPLMSADELKAMPKGQFVVMKTGAHPMKVRLKLFFDWGIAFGEPYTVTENANRKVEYAEKKELIEKIVEKYCPDLKAETEEKAKSRGGIGGQTQVESRRHFESERRTDRPFLRTSSVKRQLPLPPSLTEEERGENEPT